MYIGKNVVVLFFQEKNDSSSCNIKKKQNTNNDNYCSDDDRVMKSKPPKRLSKSHSSIKKQKEKSNLVLSNQEKNFKCSKCDNFFQLEDKFIEHAKECNEPNCINQNKEMIIDVLSTRNENDKNSESKSELMKTSIIENTIQTRVVRENTNSMEPNTNPNQQEKYFNVNSDAVDDLKQTTCQTIEMNPTKGLLENDDEDQIFACQYCDADEFVNQQSLDAHQKQFHQFVSDDTKTVLEATSDGDIQTSVTPHYQSIRPKSQNSLHVQYSSVFYDESTDSEKEDDGGNVAEGKRPSWTVIRNLKKNYQLCRDSLNTVRDKCLRKGTYIENFIEDRLVDYISKILQKMKTDRSKYVPTPVFPIGKSESSIPLMRKYCKDNISLQIDCSFKKRQVEDIIQDQNVMDCEKSHFWKDSKLLIQMYGPIEDFEKETKSLFDKLDDIFKKNGLISQVARLYCSNQYLIKTRLYLDPDTDPVFVKRRYNTTHEHILSLSKQNPNRQAQYEKLFPRFRSPMRNLKAEKNEEFIPPLPQDEVHPHYKHTCRDPEWRERMDYIKSNIIDLYKKCGWNPPENSIDSCFGECYDTRDDIFKFIQLISGGGSPEELMPEKFGYERTFLHTNDSRINNVSVIYEKPPPDFGMFPDKYRDVSLRDKYSCANSDNSSTDESESDEWISLSSSSSSTSDSNESLSSFESLSPSYVTEAIGTKSGGHYKYYSDGSFNFIRNPEKPYARQNLFDDVRAIFSDHPGENYQCEFCDKIFAKRRNLREHIKNHPPKKLLRIWLSEHQASVIQTLKKSKLSFHNSMPSDNLKSL